MEYYFRIGSASSGLAIREFLKSQHRMAVTSTAIKANTEEQI